MKLIHCADLHLDSPMESNLSAEQAKERKKANEPGHHSAAGAWLSPLDLAAGSRLCHSAYAVYPAVDVRCCRIQRLSFAGGGRGGGDHHGAGHAAGR